jgi:hypothetical protein
MESIDRAALTSLTAKFQALMPTVSAPQMPHQVALDPVGCGPAGIGGVVGVSHTPPGEILARRLRAVARVRVQTTDAAALDAAVTGVTAAVLAGDRAQQRADGLLGVDLLEIGQETTAPADGGGTRFGRDVRFRLLFEHVQAPTEAGDAIGEIHATVGDESLVIDALPAPPATALPAPHATVLPASLALEASGFEAVDDARATRNRPSAWRFDDGSGRFFQTSAIWGGVRSRSANKPGTYLLLDRGPFADLRFEALLGAEGTGAVGLVFRWQDPDNFYFLLLQGDPRFGLLGGKLAASFRSIALTEDIGLTPGATHHVVLTAQGSRFTASVDDGPPLVGEGRALSEPGRVGFLTHNEPGGFFSVGELSEL